MKKNTFKAYKEAIIKRYDEAQKEDLSGILVSPTPAQLRDFCNMKCDRGLSSADEEVMKVFFETKIDETLKRSIDNCNIDKFKPIISFLKGEKDTENQTRVGLTAILVDFSPRPFLKFTKSNLVEENDNPNIERDFDDRSNADKSRKGYEGLEIKKKNSLKKKIGIAMFVLLGISTASYTAINLISPEKQCMQWQNDHYELVDCNSGANNFSATTNIRPIDKDDLEVNKIIVCDTTTFFRAGKAVIWYCKVNGVPEFFDDLGSGFHPVTGSALRPVTQYIINKYVPHCK